MPFEEHILGDLKTLNSLPLASSMWYSCPTSWPLLPRQLHLSVRYAERVYKAGKVVRVQSFVQPLEETETATPHAPLRCPGYRFGRMRGSRMHVRIPDPEAVDHRTARTVAANPLTK